MSGSVWPCGLLPTRLLCPLDFPDKNTGVGCHFLLQGVFLTQGSNPCLLCLLKWQAVSSWLSHLGSPFKKVQRIESSKEPEPVLSASDVSKIASCPLSPIADSPSLSHLPPSLPPPVSNSSSCLFTRCQHLGASCCTALLHFSRSCTVRFKTLPLLLVFFLCIICVEIIISLLQDNT